MLVWVASYPRSGNTFLRIILHRLYGLQTSVVYDVDGVAERLGPDTIGAVTRPAPIAALRASATMHLVKTHRQRDDQVDESDPAICLVRDGRDAVLSWARLNTEADDTRFTGELRSIITRSDEVGTGSWGSNVLSWLRPPAPHRVLLRYDDLIRDPRHAVARVMAVVAPHAASSPDAQIPSFRKLQQIDGRFFRRGVTASHRDELPAELHELFCSRPENTAAMRLLGYPPHRPAAVDVPRLPDRPEHT